MKFPVFLLALLAAVPVFAQSGATPAETLTVAPGFKVELLKSAGPRDGSWISMAIDAKGRLYISPQGAIPESGFSKESKWGGLWRVTVASDGDLENPKSKIQNWEKVPVPVGDAMGMLWAFDSLYVSGQGPEGRGIYRLKDTDGDDTLDAAPMWKAVPGGAGEHGAHALVLGPDGKSLYIVHGNSTPLIDGIDPGSPYKNYREDDLLPRVMDPVATFFDKIKTPYGYVLRTDEHGTKWEILAGGFRNPYDIDFNADGELFTYDSDMEWDVGLPWYRPTRVLHVVPGGEYGFREGSAKWSAWYPDSLPAAVDIGLGCPTGVKFGTRSNFPESYRRAFFIMDWTFGRILAVHLHPRGASYTASIGTTKDTKSTKGGEAGTAGGKRAVASAAGAGQGIDGAMPSTSSSDLRALRDLRGEYSTTGPSAGGDVEVFVTGKGLPVTDLEFGNDGAMYFTIGGRGTQAGLYRVSYDLAAASTNQPELENEKRNGEVGRKQRRFHEELDPIGGAVASVGPYSDLNNNDRFARNAARLQLERNSFFFPSHLTADTTTNPEKIAPQAALTALLALARVGTKEDQAPILKALAKFPLDSLSEELKLDKLRVITVALARHGRPSPELAAMGLEKLSRQYPAQTFALNRELCQLLVYLGQDATRSGDIPVAVSRGSGSPDGANAKAAAPPADAPRAPATGMSPLPVGTTVIARTLDLMDASPEPAEQIWYALCLREAAGWTAAQRERYFAWFARARGYKGGNSFAKFILSIRDQALEKVPAADRPALLALAEKEVAPQPAAPAAPPRAFVKAWTLADLLPALPEAEKGRNFARGKALYTAAQCAQCHKFAGDGGGTGPDLTAVGSRFSRKDILEAILDPSKALSEQYASFLFTMKDGSVVAGQIAEENHYLLTLIVNPITGEKQNFPKGNVVKREMSPVSLMPPGLLSTLTQDEVRDLLAYLESGGNEKAPAFAPR